MKRRFAGLLFAVVVTLGWTTGASAQVVIQGEGQAGGVYGQGTVYVQPEPQQQQQQVIVQSPYVAQQQPQPQPVRTIIHSAPTTALLVPGVIALGGGWLLHGIISLSVAQSCEGFTRDLSCPLPVGDWAGLGWVPIAGPWLAYGLIDYLGDYAWMNILFGVVQGAGVILTVLGIAIQDEWEEAVYADLGNGVSFTMTAGPTSIGADLRF